MGKLNKIKMDCNWAFFGNCLSLLFVIMLDRLFFVTKDNKYESHIYL